MAEYGIDIPPGEEPIGYLGKALLDIVNGTTHTAVASSSQPAEAAEPSSGSSRASSGHDTEIEEAFEITDSPSRSSLDPNGATDDVVFKYFKYLPGEIRTAIWVAAAEAAKPRGEVYRFKVKKIKLVLSYDGYALAPTLFKNIRRLKSDDPVVREVRELMKSVYRLDDLAVSFTPFPEVGSLTREIRDLFRSCPEARSELVRHPAFGSSFKFHWADEQNRCDIGVMRPFCYETDWVSLSGLRTYRGRPVIQPCGEGVHCTLDIARIQHVAIPYSEIFGMIQPYSMMEEYFRSLSGFHNLKSLGIYERSFTVKKVSHWDNLLTHEQRLFLKGVPSSASDGSTTRGRRLTSRSFQRAMTHIKSLIQNTAVMVMVKKREHWDPALQYLDYAGLQFCFLLHADSKAGLDLMEFEEDGSHLGDIARIQDLGDLGREVKALRISGR